MTEHNNAHNCCVVITSCDAYHDAWDPFLQFFDRYWPDCPWPAWLITNKRTVQHSHVQTFATGSDPSWADNLLKLLDDLRPDSIVYMHEDFFLQNPVDSNRLQQVVDYASQSGVGYIRLAGKPEPDLTHDNPFGLGELSRGLKFRCSLQAAWWNVETLRKLLVRGENAWQMEVDGSRRSDQVPEPFLSVRSDQPLIDYYHETGILKGRWLPGALKFCRREGIAVDTSHRPIHPRLPLFLKRIRKSRPVEAVRDLFRADRG